MGSVGERTSATATTCRSTAACCGTSTPASTCPARRAAPYTITTGIRRQRRYRVQRPAGPASGATARAGPERWNHERELLLHAQLRQRKVALPPGISITSVGGAMSRRAGQASQAEPVPARVQRQHLQPHQPAEPRRLQRRHDLAVLRPADGRQRRPAREHGRELLVLTTRPRRRLEDTEKSVSPCLTLCSDAAFDDARDSLIYFQCNVRHACTAQAAHSKAGKVRLGDRVRMMRRLRHDSAAGQAS